MSLKTNREDLICNNLKLVHSICQRFKNKGIEYDDLFQAGSIGLIKAADAFDPSKGFAFSTYAFPVIMGEIKRLFRDGGSIKISRSLKERYLKINAVSQKLANKFLRPPKISEIAKELNITTEEVAVAVSACSAPSSLSFINEDGEIKETDIGVNKSAEETVIKKVMIEELINKLPEKDKDIIVQRFFNHKTQTQTAKALGLTQVAVSRSEKRILNSLKTALK